MNSTEMRHKRGDVREDGMVFCGYRKTCQNGEWWVTSEKFEEKMAKQSAYRQTEESRAKQRENQARYRQTERGRAKQRGYKQTEEYRAKQLAYRQTEEYRAKQRERSARHIRTENGRAKNHERKAYYYSTPEGKAIIAVRSSTRRAARFAGVNKPSRSFALLGTDLETFTAHIESLFTEGMCWEKMGKEIHIDHIVPLASGKTPEEIWDLCHYTNLQPLWAGDNLRKSAKLPEFLPA